MQFASQFNYKTEGFLKVARYDDLVTVKPVIADGHLILPTGPGWGTEVNEEAVRAHPPRKR